MPNRLLSYLLVIVQFSSLLALALTGPVIAKGLLLGLEVAAIALGGWAIVAMRIGNFNVTPEPKVSGQLVQRGPYRWIRHPMYTSLIWLSAVLLINQFSWLRLLLFIVLVVDLVIKLTYEETRLVGHFPGYADYQGRSWRLLPFLY